MALIPLPTKFAFTSVSTWGLQRSTNVLRSKYTGAAQIVTFPYAVWMFEGDLVEYDDADLTEIKAFLTDLEGQKNTFRLPVPGYTKPTTGFVGNAAYGGNGDVYVAAASRVTSLTIDVHQASVPLFNRGDHFTINDELKEVTGSVATDINGRATVGFKPALRKPALFGTTVIIQNPTVLMRAADDNVGIIGLKPPYRLNKTFAAIEAVEI